MITIREIANNETKISSTRWAFATTIVFDMIMIVLSLAAFLFCNLTGHELDISFLYAVVAMLGVLTGITGTAKALQGFENNSGEEKTVEEKPKKVEEEGK